jgi:hypothetical protein
MKLFKISILLLLISFFIIGCSDKTPSPISSISIKEGKGVIFIYRPKNDIWAHKRYLIYINNNYEDMLMNGKSYVFNKPAGKYKIEIKEDVEINPEVFTLTTKLKEGKINYIRFATDSIDGYLNLKEVIKAKAVYEDDKYKNMY